MKGDLKIPLLYICGNKYCFKIEGALESGPLCMYSLICQFASMVDHILRLVFIIALGVEITAVTVV